MDIFISILVIIFGYLIGSIPTGYIAGRLFKGIDLRKYGSGTVSGSMVYEHVGKFVVVPVGLFDIFKGALPAWIALQLGLGDIVVTTAGLAAVLGHNWPVYLGFTGGRGISPFMGLLLVIFPWGAVWIVIFLAVGFFLGDSAPWAIASMITLPIVNFLLDGPTATYWAVVGMLLITFVKRLEANRRPLPEDSSERREVILLRLFFDRDIWNHREWIDRGPESAAVEDIS